MTEKTVAAPLLRPVITTKGLAAANQAATLGKPAVISHMVVSATPGAANAADTTLPGQGVKVPITDGRVISDNQVNISALLPDTYPSTDICGIGFYLADGTFFASYRQAAPFLIHKTGETLLIGMDFVMHNIPSESIIVESTGANLVFGDWVPEIRRINNKQLKTDITLTPADVKAVALDGSSEMSGPLKVKGSNTGLHITSATYPGLRLVSENLTDANQKYIEVNASGDLSIITRDKAGAVTGNVTVKKGQIGEVYHTGNKPSPADIGTYTKKEIDDKDATKVPTSRKVNNKALTGDISLTPGDVGAVPTNRLVNGLPLTGDINLRASHVQATPQIAAFDTSNVGGRVSWRIMTLNESDAHAAFTIAGQGDHGEKTRGWYDVMVSTRTNVILVRAFQLGTGNADPLELYTKKVGDKFELWAKFADYNRSTPLNLISISGAVTHCDSPSVNKDYTGFTQHAIERYYTTQNKPSADDVGAVPTSRRVNNKPLTGDITLNAADVGASASSHGHSDLVPNSRKVNNKALTGDITLNAADVGAVERKDYANNMNLDEIRGGQQFRLTHVYQGGPLPSGELPYAQGIHVNGGSDTNLQIVGGYNKSRIFWRGFNNSMSSQTGWAEFYTTLNKPTADDVLGASGSHSKIHVIEKPAGAVDGKCYPILLSNLNDYSEVFIDTRTSAGGDPMNNCNFKGFVRAGGWTDRGSYVAGMFNIYVDGERAIRAVVGCSESDNAAAFYVEAQAFPVRLVVNSKVRVTVGAQSISHGTAVFNAALTAPEADADYGTKTKIITSFDRGSGWYAPNMRVNWLTVRDGMNLGDRVQVSDVEKSASFITRRKDMLDYAMMGHSSGGQAIIGLGDGLNYRSYLQIGLGNGGLKYAPDTSGVTYEVYHKNNKPNAADVGALAANGSNKMTGTLVVEYGGYGAIYRRDKYPGFVLESTGLTSSRTKLIEVNDQGTLTIITRDDKAANNGVVTIAPGKSGEVYHTGNKPSAADVKALALDGSNKMTAALKSAAGALFEGSVYANYNSPTAGSINIGGNPSGYGEIVGKAKGQSDYQWNNGIRYYDDNTWRIGSQKIYHEGFKPNAADVGAMYGSSMSNVLRSTGNAVNQWQTLARVRLPQNAATARITVVGGNGFNMGNSSQCQIAEIVLRSGNNNPKGISALLTNHGEPGNGVLIRAVAWKNVSGDDYDIVVQAGNYGNTGIRYEFSGASSTLIHWGSDAPVADKPAGLTDAAIANVYTTLNKPTAADVGAVNKAGDTMTGNLGIPSGGLLVGGVEVVGAAGDVVRFGDGSFARTLNLNAKDGLAYIQYSGSVKHRLYHAGFKPTAADAGAVSETGGTYNGNFRFRMRGGAGWPDKVPTSQSNYIRRAGGSVLANNSGLHFFGDEKENARRMGIQAGHSDAGYCDSLGALDLNPFGGDVRANGHKVYSAGNKPSAADVGAYPQTGGNLSGNFRVKHADNAEHTLGTLRQDRNFYMFDNGTSVGIFTANLKAGQGNAVLINRNIATGAIGVGDAAAPLSLFGNAPAPTYNGNNVYHSGFKPTPGDIGAAAASHSHSNYVGNRHNHYASESNFDVIQSGGAGQVGSYALLQYSGDAGIANIVSGSLLRWSSCDSGHNDANPVGYGSWKPLGRTFNNGVYGRDVTLWIRIA